MHEESCFAEFSSYLGSLFCVQMCGMFFQGNVCSFCEGYVFLCLWSIALVTCPFLCTSLFKLLFCGVFLLQIAIHLKEEGAAMKFELHFRVCTYLNPGSNNNVRMCFMVMVVGKKPTCAAHFKNNPCLLSTS